MKLEFIYDKEKDGMCLLQFGKTSINASAPTEIYETFTKEYGEELSQKDARLFIDSYLENKKLDAEIVAKNYQEDWATIAEEYKKIAESVFGISLPYDVTAYLTINTRTPYNIEDRYFYVSFPSPYFRKTAMHELWHFYTWERFGKDEGRIGAARYNEIKEALTVLLNTECENILPENVIDRGYPQHQKLRKEILIFWEQEKDIEKLWSHFTQQ